MCGICGFINYNEESTPDPELIKKMIGSLSHRGPDSSGYYRDNQIALGHSRLSIIDLTSGAQPLSNENGSIWISFNGEIYNYIEIRKELINKGHKFSTKSDTEVILHAWEQWGSDCFNKFNGQWAFAIWDSQKKKLIISRDRHGIRPLYYTSTGKRFLYGSEIKALFTDPSVERRFSPTGLAQVFTFWSPVAPATVFDGINELEPGSYAEISRGEIKIKPYWNVNFQKKGFKRPDIDTSVEELKELLIDSTKLRFDRSDVPVGAYLSGGIDSSITASIIAAHTNTKLKTFSLRFEDEEFDEGNFQQTMVNRLGTDHNIITISYSDIGEIFPKVIRHTERPILRTAPAPLYLLSGLVKDSGLKVVVTGEGADEILAGYDIFREAKVRLAIAEDPENPINQELIHKLYPWMNRAPGNVPSFANAFFRRDLNIDDPGLSHRPRWNTTSAIFRICSKDFVQSLSGYDPAEDFLSKLPEDHSKWEDLSRAQWIEYKTLLSSYILSAQGDRMLMANSVEGRFPFLDHRVTEFADRLPTEYKLNDLDEKYILKKAFSDLIPEEILNRPKQPYRAPDAASFYTEGNIDWVKQITAETNVSKSGIFNPGSVEKLFNKGALKKGIKLSNTENMLIVGVLSTLLTYNCMIEQTGRETERISDPETIIDRASI